MPQLPREFIDSLFAADLPSPERWEDRYPPRHLRDRARVTRFGPSPTGFVHIGGIYVALISKDIARTTRGVFFVRVEDTDQRREVPAARAQFDRAFHYFHVEPDEDDETGIYGPYEQSRRAEIYATYARELLRAGDAYMCFCTAEMLQERSAQQRSEGQPPGYYGRWAMCRHRSDEEVVERVSLGELYTVRFRTPDDVPLRVSYHDLIRGEIEQDNNRNDVVSLKSSDVQPRLPTYHFAHAVDDHLMRVNLVIRSEEWISSVPLHLQLFDALGFPAIPYAHIAPLMKMDGSSRRKLSKRKDAEANVDFYLREGFPAEGVLLYLRGLANSRIADADPAGAQEMRIDLGALGVAGPLVDLAKLESICRNWIAGLPASRVYEEVLAWARAYDEDVAALLVNHRELATRALAVEREGTENPRKDLAKWSDFQRLYGFFIGLLPERSSDDPRLAPVPAHTAELLATDFVDHNVHDLDAESWFGQIRAAAERHSFAPSVKEYKREPTAYAGSIKEASNVIRYAITGVTRSPDLYEISRVLGEAEIVRRVSALAASGEKQRHKRCP
jgi:glutamyl-tRNA synthetase